MRTPADMASREPLVAASGRGAPAPIAIAGAAIAITAAIALLGGTYLANDDDLLIEFFRDNAAAPFIAPALSQLMGALYAAVPSLPWFGLWLYAVHALALGVTAAAVLDLPADAPRALRRALWIGGGPILAGVAALALRPTYGSAGIAGCFAGLVAISSELGRPGGVRTGRAVAAGLALAAGLTTRLEAVPAAVSAMAPLLAASAWRIARGRRMPPVRFFAQVLAPAALVLAIGPAMPQRRDPEAQRYLAFNHARHILHFQNAYTELDQRAPELLAEAGWTAERYWQFTNRFYFVDDWFTPERLARLHDTGGAPRPVLSALPTRIHDAWKSAEYAAPLLAAIALAAIALAAMRRIRPGAAALAALHVPGLLAVALALERWMHFPDRIAVPMALGAACAVLVTARDGAERAGPAAWTAALPWRRPLPALALAAALLLALLAIGRTKAFYAVHTGLPPCAALESRIAARHPQLVVSYLEPTCDLSPLRAAPRDYPSITLTWPIFSPQFYRGLARLGVHDARDLVPALIARPDAYVLARRYYLANLTRGLSTAALGVGFTEVDASGPGELDLVLSHAIRAAPAGGARQH